ncbi:helix-turn-helix domain-containing protein [Massilia endophytica]|uniref:helix-turn-helix domain-containing protein n=1 Tax=Massilia endophytica TaxID=2899220 RepID=UPI001E59EB53|nr:helix-turn-helix domain-containing protein [Massilia endophytica]UGQ48224.1 helix-turn-helix domain-containing protein [Massilia endophytica]
MADHTPTKAPVARLLLPRRSLASCIRAGFVRNTLDCGELPPGDRLNRYPASMFSCITWTLEGELAMVEPPDPAGGVLAAGQALVNGLQSQPTVTGSPGPVHFMGILFFPDALHRLAGIDMALLVDRMLPLEQVLDGDWQAMSARVVAAPDDDARMAVIEDFLEPRWRAVRAAEQGALGQTGAAAADWLRSMAARAALAGLGRSARMAERRLREWAGLPMRTLRRIRRAEQSFIEARDEVLKGKVSWSDIAARGGYADQAHLSRESRQLSGLTPSELARLCLSDESYWMYRIWA